MGELIELFTELGVTPPTHIICYLLFRSVKAHESVLNELRIMMLEWKMDRYIQQKE